MLPGPGSRSLRSGTSLLRVSAIPRPPLRGPPGRTCRRARGFGRHPKKIRRRVARPVPGRAVHDDRIAAGARDAALRAGTERGPAVVLGFAENATALGQLVADALDADHLVTSTRRLVDGAATLGDFQEVHSHAARHLL